MKHFFYLLLIAIAFISCKENENKAQEKVVEKEHAYFDWSAANVYFLLTDRFNNGDTSNDKIIDRSKETGKLRGFEGGDFAGIIEKIDEGYFTDLGVNAIWLTPIWEQIHGGVDEGTGFTYAFHGYWAKDWTAVEPSYGTMEEFKTLVEKAHEKDIRILLDVVINHTGPVTDQDPVWPEEWVRTGPGCSYQDQATAVTCTLTNNLPDIKTESTEEVDLPEHLVAKWKKEGRYEQEIKELNDFFAKSGLKRTPVNYIIKWVTDYARETGVDGFRIDTVKHVEESIWATFNEQAKLAYEQWKENNPSKTIHDDDFFILGELYGYSAVNGRSYGFSSGDVDYFDSGYDAMIDFGFKYFANEDYQKLFKKYDSIRKILLTEKPNDPVYFMNYISSHDDGQPFDPRRERAMESATKLMLSPGMSQIYYGDENARSLDVEGTVGDATLRSVMDFDKGNQEILKHWQQLGKFRNEHQSVGAGEHFSLAQEGEGTLAARFYNKNGHEDIVLIGAGLPDGLMEIDVIKVFPKAKRLRNAYTIKKLPVVNGKVTVMVKNGVVLLEKM
ncbi:alpha-amylase [Nonlabens dokdonensis]|jgi:alpha-amylase|uniref:Glycosyl hydrolase catalytic region, alpha-amylase family n=2 Tax=Nonlabens dokdonensis TaxID=328515 RepID=L7WBN5_NONDD|nr:alpha-amylase family glycosyl hydrolase [Nonlabens dokdonensis]AGC77632.1 glycosyl hydrolase catalytic region, alpha-amylase family [Nonlabens dokdonensis DSW-6]PZX39821.1 alpha-amylase [Nonlabens dokdonensis]